MRILVTGGAGFIGSHLVDRLLADGHDVRVLDNLRRGRMENLPLADRRLQFVKGDIRSAADVAGALADIEVVFHLAAQSNVLGAATDVAYSFTTNVAGTFEVLLSAERAGVRRVVFSSSREVYGQPDALPVAETAPLNPKNAYGASKAAGELYCRVFAERGMDIRILRLANVYGMRDRDRVIPIFLENARGGAPLRLNGGTQLIDFVWIGDVVDALCRAGMGARLPGPVNVGNGKPTAIRDLARRILELTGSASPIEVAPANEIEVAQFAADTSRAREWLGLEPAADPLSHLADMLPARGTQACVS